MSENWVTQTAPSTMPAKQENGLGKGVLGCVQKKKKILKRVISGARN